MELDLSYVLNGASWTSAYDVRVDSDKKSCELIYNGVIVNRTGEDWKDVSVGFVLIRADQPGAFQRFSVPWRRTPSLATPKSGLRSPAPALGREEVHKI